jgi:hypothetical protein
MATLQDVRDRLERAVGRLESAQEAYKARHDAKLAELRREALAAGETAAGTGSVGPGGADPGSAGGPEMDDLLKALEETQAHNQALVDEREALADQIDTVIGRLRAALSPDDGPGPNDSGSAR